MKKYERKLSRLTIHAYADREMKNIVGTVKAMYNPDELQLNYRTTYESKRYINDNRQSNTYLASIPGGLNLELVFDARMPENKKRPLELQLKELHELCSSLNPVTGEPNFLAVSWGRMTMGGEGRDFIGRTTDFMVKYTIFDPDGTPLRASVSMAFTADSSLVLQTAKHNLKSPTVSILSVPNESSLPLLAKQAGSMLKGGIDPLSLADSNDLDSLNALKPGQLLKAPASGGL